MALKLVHMLSIGRPGLGGGGTDHTRVQGSGVKLRDEVVGVYSGAHAVDRQAGPVHICKWQGWGHNKCCQLAGWTCMLVRGLHSCKGQVHR
jgi:hypothetical protein